MLTKRFSSTSSIPGLGEPPEASRYNTPKRANSSSSALVISSSSSSSQEEDSCSPPLWAEDDDSKLVLSAKKAEWLDMQRRKLNGKLVKGKKKSAEFIARHITRRRSESCADVTQGRSEDEDEIVPWDSQLSEEARQQKVASYNDLVRCRTALLSKMFPRVSPRMLKALLLRNDADVDAVEQLLESRGWESLRSKDIHNVTRYYVGQFAEDIVDLMAWSPLGTYCTAFIPSLNCYGLFYKDKDSQVQRERLSSGPEITPSILKRFDLSYPLSRPTFRSVCDACGKNTPCTISESEFARDAFFEAKTLHKNQLRPFPVLIPDPSFRETTLILDSLDC